MRKYTFHDIWKKGIKNTDCLTAIVIAEKIAVPITWFLLNFTRLKPNHVTMFRLFVIFPLVIYSFLHIYDRNFALLGALLYFLNYVLDIVDGAMARVARMKSGFGAFLDSLSDRLNNLVIVSSILGISTYNLSGRYNTFIKPYSYFFLFLYISYLVADRVFVKHFTMVKSGTRKTHFSYRVAGSIILKIRKFIFGKEYIILKNKRKMSTFGGIEILTIMFVVFPVLFFVGIIDFNMLSLIYVIFSCSISLYILLYFARLYSNRERIKIVTH